MNKTRKLTLGAMLLAIIGAVMLIDRQLSFFFTEFILLLAPVVIIIYGCMYTFKDAAILGFGLIVLTLLFGSMTSYVYMPIGTVVGLGFVYGVSKNFDRRKLTLITIALYVLGEVIATFVVMPLLGIDVASQISELNKLMEEYNLSQALGALGNNMSTLLIVLYVASTILVGVLEGYLTCLLATLLLKRLKIKNIGVSNVLGIVISPVAAYILFGLSVLTFLDLSVVINKWEVLAYIIVCVSLISSLILAYYGYIFLISYGKLKLGNKAIIFILIFVFLMFPLSYIVLIILGFLFGAGPLRNKLEAEMEKTE